MHSLCLLYTSRIDALLMNQFGLLVPLDPSTPLQFSLSLPFVQLSSTRFICISTRSLVNSNVSPSGRSSVGAL